MSARPAAPAARGAAAPAQKDWQSTVKSLVTTLGTFILIQTAMKYGMSYMGLGPQQSQAPAAPAATPAGSSGAVTGGTPASALVAHPAWDKGTPMSMMMYLSTAPSVAETDLSSPLLVWDNLIYGNWSETREADFELDVPLSVRADNGSWFMDILLVKGGGRELAGTRQEDVAAFRKELTRFLPKRRVRKEKLLFGGDHAEGAADDEDEDDAAKGPMPVIAHWSRNLTLGLVTDFGAVNLNSAQPQVAPHIKLVPGTSESKQYFPPVFPNDFWLLRETLLSNPINSTTTQLPLHISLSALSALKFQLYSSMTASFEQAAQQQGTGAEMDEIKRMLTETNPILLITTAIVTILHVVFETLAFSSDIGDWRKRKSNVGVSLRSILTNCVIQAILLLFLVESSEETSYVILASQGIGLLIEAWKITKVVDIRVRPAPGSLVGYAVTFEDKHELSEDEKKTQEYDRLAFRIVSYAAVPILAAYATYSALYKTHRSYYSFCVTTAAQAIYLFGFAQLVPQLIINYKLKSVAHMPLKTMIFKVLTTTVDDFAAFCIKQPWITRLAAFRDDRWQYSVDYTRANEFGQVASKGDEKSDEVESKKDK